MNAKAIIDAVTDPAGPKVMLGAIIDPEWNLTTLWYEGETFEQGCENHLRRHHLPGTTDPETFEKHLQAMPGERKALMIANRVKINNASVFQRLSDNERARWELFSRKRKITDVKALTTIEQASDIDTDDVILWKQFPGDDRIGKLVYAGVVFYGEPDTRENDPNYTPRERPKKTPKKLGQPRKLR